MLKFLQLSRLQYKSYTRRTPTLKHAYPRVAMGSAVLQFEAHLTYVREVHPYIRTIAIDGGARLKGKRVLSGPKIGLLTMGFLQCTMIRAI